MAERDYAELAKQYTLGKIIQRKRFTNTWYDLTQEDFDENGNIIFNELDAYRIKPCIEPDSGIINMTSNILYALRKFGYSSRDTCASIQNGIVRVKDGPGNVWRITITKE